MNVSIVVCTRNRSVQLQRCLMALSKLKTKNPFELIVVDNGSSDRTSDVLLDFKKIAKFPVSIYFEPLPGLGRARNVGWKNSIGSVIAFTDDDCYPENHWIDNLCFCFSDQSISYLGGRVELYDPSDLPITIQLKENCEDILPYSFVTPGFIQGANFSFRRDALELVDGFDPDLGAGTPFPCEDVEILARMSAKGLKGRYDPRPLVYHHHGRKTSADLVAIKKSYDYGRGAYYAKCIVCLPTRLLFLKNWYWSFSLKNLISGQLIRELNSFFRYLKRRYLWN